MNNIPPTVEKLEGLLFIRDTQIEDLRAEITALQSQLSEKDKEIEDLKSKNDRQAAMIYHATEAWNKAKRCFNEDK